MGPTIELYDMLSDQNEKENIINQYLQIILELEKELLAFIKYANIKGLKPPVHYAIDSDMRRRLNALGYLQ